MKRHKRAVEEAEPVDLASMIAMTMQKHAHQIAMNVMQSNAMLKRLQAKGIIKPFTGGMKV